jgi:hypothetical protein
MSGRPEGRGSGWGCSPYFWRVFFILLAVFLMIAYILYLTYKAGVPFEALIVVAWLFSFIGV